MAGYVGLEFADRGRTREGVDCWGLVSMVYAERFGVLLPAGGYERVDDFEGVALTVVQERDERRGWRRMEADEARIGDVLLFRLARGWHVGLVVARYRMLHAQAGSRSCVERTDSPLWSPRLEGVYRHAGPVRLTARLRPLAGPRIDLELPGGMSLAEMLAAAGVPPTGPTGPLRVFVGDREVPAERWAHVRPKPGRQVIVTAVPVGGGGKAARIILSIAVIAAAMYAPYAIPGLTATAGGVTTVTLAGSFVSTGIALAGTLAINALIPAPRPRLSDNSGDRPSLSITGGRNELRPYGVVPVVLGRHRIAPLYGARPYTEIAGDDQYLRCLFVPGYGPLDLSDFRIGDTALDEYEGVELEVRRGLPGDPPLTLFPGIVHEEALSLLIEHASGFVVRTTELDTDEISIDLTWPQGLVQLTAGGQRLVRAVALDVEYSPAGLGTWVPVAGESPSFERGLAFMFRTPEVTFGGQEAQFGSIEWGLAFAGPKPAYLPPTNYSWEAFGWIFIDSLTFPGGAGPVQFGIDSSDAAELTIDGVVVVSWYGSHSTAGGATPDYAAHASAAANIADGWHTFRVRMECRTTSGAIAVGWKRPGDVAFAAIPGDVLSEGPGEPFATGILLARWYDTSSYDGSVLVESDRTVQIRRTLSWPVARGQYDVRVRRVTPDTNDDLILDKVYWTALRSFHNEDPIRLKGMAKIALRIKATDQLNGAVEQFNCMARSVVPDWDPIVGRWIARGTGNPASLYRAVLQGPANARAVGDGRVDLTELAAWHESCTENGYTFNGVLDFAGTVWERLHDIAAAGRATPGMRDGKHSIVRDRKQTVPAQHLTPRNSSGFKGRKAWPDTPHALRVQFINANTDYQRDERMVLDDGYQIDGLDAFGQPAPELPLATKFEVIELLGVTDPDQAFKHGRYYLAVLRLRPEVYELSTDIEHLVSTRGDLVLVTHDVPQFGLAFGRVASLVVDADDNLIGLGLDDAVTMDAGEQYVIRVRLDDGESWLRPVVTAAGVSRSVSIGPVSVASNRPKVGDLWMFGRLARESRELLVKSIDVDRDLSARITLVDHAPAVHDAEKGAIPAYDPGLSQPPAWEQRPEAPVIESIRSDDSVMVRDPDGSLHQRMVITLRQPSGTKPPASAAQVRLRSKPPPPTEPTGPWTALPQLPIDDNQVSVRDVEKGTTYQVRLRTVTALGLASPWVAAEHTVIGKVRPPPDVQGFECVRLADGTRRFSWVLGPAGGVPPDIAGVRIRHGPGGLGTGWSGLTPLHEGTLPAASPQELNVPAAGLWTLAIKMADTSGNESVNARSIDRELGPPREQAVAISVDARKLAWPGARTGCYLSDDGTLVSVGREHWDTLASVYGVSTWAQWASWTMDPTPQISYDHQFDIGFLLDFEPSAYVVTAGPRTVLFDHSRDGVAWAGFKDLGSFAGLSVRARHVRFKVTARLDGFTPIPIIRELVMTLRAEMAEEQLQAVNTASIAADRRFGPGDVALPISAGLFAQVRSVTVMFLWRDAGGWTSETVNKLVVPGPRVRLYRDGVPADSVVDVLVKGLRSADGSSYDPGDAGALDFSDADNSMFEWI